MVLMLAKRDMKTTVVLPLGLAPQGKSARACEDNVRILCPLIWNPTSARAYDITAEIQVQTQKWMARITRASQYGWVLYGPEVLEHGGTSCVAGSRQVDKV